MQVNIFSLIDEQVVAGKGKSYLTGLILTFIFLVINLSLLHCTALFTLAAEKQFTVNPKWIRPGPNTTVIVKLPADFDSEQKLFLRLIMDNSFVKDLPIPNKEQVRRRVAEVKVTAPLRRGTYKSELINEDGETLAKGQGNIKVAAAEKPIIQTVMPRVIYSTAGKFDFEVIGENFSQYQADEIKIRINDVEVPFAFRKDARGNDIPNKELCNDTWPCLIMNWRTMRIFGLSIAEHHIGRPLQIRVEADQLVSEPQPLVFSCVHRFMPIVIAFAILGAVIALVYFISVKKIAYGGTGERKTHTTLTYLFLDPQTNTFSLSKFQLITWAAAAILTYSYLTASQFFVQWKLGLPNVPEGLPMLLGISTTTTAVSVGATAYRGSKGAGSVNPALGDFITSGGVFAPERLQFFIWTILGALGFVVATLAQDPGTVEKMAEIPENFNQFMGVSSLGYLAGKFARKPGPVIKSITWDPKGIKIIGENLSPRAQVKLNDILVSPDLVHPGLGQPEEAEFVSELAVKLKKEKPATKEIEPVQVKNPDGQQAEWSIPPV